MAIQTIYFDLTLLKGGRIEVGKHIHMGYLGNRGIYKIRLNNLGAWGGDAVTVRAYWHPLEGMEEPQSTLAVDGVLDVPASVTAVAGVGQLVLEGIVGSQVITSANIPYRVGDNAGTQEGDAPEPESSAWQQFVEAIGEKAETASASAKEAEAWAHGREDFPDTAEDNAKYYAEQAKQVATHNGFVHFDISEDGCLWMERTSNFTDLNFTINSDGELEALIG